MKTERIINCSNCGAPFHGLSKCKRTVDGNDPLFVRINAAADIMIDLALYADSRNQPQLQAQAAELYAQVLELRLLVNLYAQPKEVK